MICPLTLELSAYARDAMAKAVYGRTFTWLVNKINSSLVNKVGSCILCALCSLTWPCFITNTFEEFVRIERKLLVGRDTVFSRLHFQSLAHSRLTKMHWQMILSVCPQVWDAQHLKCTQNLFILTVIYFNVYKKKKRQLLWTHPKGIFPF